MFLRSQSHERKAILLLYLFFSFFVVVLNEISNVNNEQKCIDLIHGIGLLKMTGYLINQSINQEHRLPVNKIFF